MSRPSEEISKYNANSGGKTDSNLANDALHLGGIEAEEYATKKYVQDYHDNKEISLKEYIDRQDNSILQESKAYVDKVVQGQDFSDFAKMSDIKALDDKLSQKIEQCGENCANNLDARISQVVNDTNANFDDINKAITNLNNTSNELFQSVSNGKQLIAGAITDKGVNTSANDSFNNMANNIRKIVTIGPGGIPEGYIDTSDATATASDILRGKTAYSKGKKITGTYDTEINPDNPGKITADLELIYGVKEGEFSVNNVYSSVPSMYAISCDRRVLAIYDNENKTIKMYQRSGNSYVKAVTDKGEILTPDYTLADLGITYNDDLEVCQLNFSSMNNNFDCKLAVCLRKTQNTITDEETKQWYVHIFTCSTYYGQLESENKGFSNGEDGTIINHHILESENTSTCSSLEVVFSSSNCMDLLVNVNGSSITVYHLYEYLGILKDTYRKGYSFSHSMVSGSLRFFGNSRLISYWYTTNNASSSHTVLIVLSKLLNSKLGEAEFYPNTAFTVNGEHAFYMNNGSIMSNGGIIDKVNINYDTGNITRETTATNLINDAQLDFTWYNGRIQFDKSGKYIYIQAEQEFYDGYICYIEDYEKSSTLPKVQTIPKGSKSLITLLSDWNTGIYTRYEDIRLYHVELDTDIIKAIKYNENYYILSN